MMSGTMNWAAVENFILVAELGHVSQAAERRYISQPALSRQIRGLEEDLGFNLFERHGRKMTLTPSGQMFLEEARELLASLNQTNQAIERIRLGQKAAVRIAASSVVLRYIIAPALVEFSRVEPETDVMLYEADNDIQALLRDGRAEVIVCGRFPDRKNLTWHELYSFHLFALMHPDHLLARREQVELDDLLNDQLLLLSTGKSSQLLYAGVIDGQRPRRVVESHNAETLLTLAEAGLGVAVLSDSVDFTQHKVAAIPFMRDGAHLGSTTYAAWPKGRHVSAPALRFLDFVRRERAEVTKTVAPARGTRSARVARPPEAPA
jgi:DNA-binding transcriptional LysR family regulator